MERDRIIRVSDNLRKGPPDAVMITSSTLLLLLPFNKDHIEKCSESTGMNLVLYFFNLC